MSLRNLVFVACLLTSAAWSSELVTPFASETYVQSAGTKGVVLVSANWGRKWKCGAFDNAQLKSISFDRADSSKQGTDAKADLTLADASLLPAPSRFTNYAYIVEPGEYLVSGYSIKAAKSISDVGAFNATRTDLVKDGKSKAGSFSIAAGELVYIGHFFVDCYKEPIPWRFYPSSKDDFNQYLAGVKKEFEGLPVEKVKFRLLNTSTLGEPFSLP